MIIRTSGGELFYSIQKLKIFNLIPGSMRAGALGLCQVTDGAFLQSSGMALQIDKLDSIVRLLTGSDGMCAVMAGLAVYTAVPGGHTI